MWKTLNSGQNVCVGDKIRYTNKSFGDHCKVFKVEKTDQYYFVISPEEISNSIIRSPQAKVVRHFDIGNYLELELWQDHGAIH